MNYSTTQASNIAAFVGLLVLVLQHFNIKIGSDELTTFIGAVLAAGGIIRNWIHRYRQGDITLGGFRK